MRREGSDEEENAKDDRRLKADISSLRLVHFNHALSDYVGYLLYGLLLVGVGLHVRPRLPTFQQRLFDILTLIQ